jgi:ubiquitin-protein ligase
VWIGPLDDRNLYVWHFTIVGLPGSPFDGGLYHGRVVLPRSYPLQPPRVQVWTESGRFVPRMDICLSASAYHPETWSPTHWTIRTLVESLRLHMATSALEVGSMNAPYEQRVTLAAASRKWKIRVPLSSGKLVTIDHDKMIRQGLFDGLLDVHDNEGLAVKSSKRVTVKRIEDSESLEEGSTMRKAEAKKRKQNRGSRRDGPPVLTGSNSVSSARHTAVQPVKDPLGVRILVAGLRLIPWLVAAWLWRVVLAWVLPA